MSVNRPLTGYRLAEIRYHDTLQEIAARELGDARRWADIVAINDLKPPYLTGDEAAASASVKLYGQMLLVPAPVAGATSETDAEAVFGVDVDLTNGLLSVERGDFRLIKGRANLRQALNHRVKTHLGELLFHLLYGCGVYRLKGKVNGPTAGLLGAQYVRGALLADPRVKSVNRVSARQAGDVVPIEAEITPIVGTSPVGVSL